MRTINNLGRRIRNPITVKAVDAHPGAVEGFRFGVADSHHCDEDPDMHKKPNQDPHNKGWIRIRINAAIRTRELHYSVAGRRANNYASSFSSFHTAERVTRRFRLGNYVPTSVADPDLGSGIRCLFDPWIRDGFFPDPGSPIPNPYF
jgi:hypothetical protein